MAITTSLSGLAVMSGTNQSALRPWVFSESLAANSAWPLLVRGVAGYISQTAMVALTSDDAQSWLVPMSGVALMDQPLAQYTFPLSAVAGEPIRARFDDRLNAPCDSLVLAFAGDVAVHVQPLCGAGGALAAESETAIALPNGDVIKEGVLALDLDGDGHLDLLIGGVAQHWAAFGDGAGRFGASASLPGTDPVVVVLEQSLPGGAGDAGPASSARDAGSVTLPGDAGGPGPLTLPDGGGLQGPTLGNVLAAGSLASGALFLATSTAVLLVQQAVPGASSWIAVATPLELRSVGEWTSAIAVDVNGDGATDLIAASSSSEVLDLFLQINGSLDSSTITSHAPVAALTAGDFDGDGVNDVAWVERTSVSDDVLDVAFGQAGGVPLAPLEMARPGTTTRIEAAAFEGQEARLDLVGMLDANDGGPERLAAWSGQGLRQLMTTLSLAGTTADGVAVSGLAVMIAAGHFSGGTHDELVAVAVDQTSLSLVTQQTQQERLWLVDLAQRQVAVPGDILSGVDVLSGSMLAGETGGSTLRAVLAVGDLNGDGRDDLVLVAAQNNVGAQLAIAQWVDGGLVLGTPQTVSNLAFAPAPSSHAELVDIAGRGEPEFLLLAKGANGERALLGCPNQRGALSADCVALSAPGSPEALAAIRTGQGRRPLVLTSSGLYLGQSAGAAGEIAFSVLAGVPGGKALAVGDSNGDGLDDLFISNGESVQLWLGQRGVP